jgi:hypothetical protein
VSEKKYIPSRLEDKSQTLPELKNFVYIFQSTARRKSVFAETYDPEEEDDDEQSAIHPKTDLQRKALKEAVKEILLFRSLEPDQLNEVLDAMFGKEAFIYYYVRVFWGFLEPPTPLHYTTLINLLKLFCHLISFNENMIE